MLTWGVSEAADPTLYVCARREQANATTSRDTCAIFSDPNAELNVLPPDR